MCLMRTWYQLCYKIRLEPYYEEKSQAPNKEDKIRPNEFRKQQH